MSAISFHVMHKGANLLDLNLFMGLGFSLTDNCGTEILQVAFLHQRQWPVLFDGLGCLSAFIHQPKVDPTVTPVIQPLRRIPLTLRDEVTAELKARLDSGIIEPINASLWISNLLIPKNKLGWGGSAFAWICVP